MTIAWYDPTNHHVSTDKNDPRFTPLGQLLPLDAPREWVDLTDSQIEQVYYDLVKIHRGAPMPWGQINFGKTLQALIKEKNT
jgi:hypothetical protein